MKLILLRVYTVFNPFGSLKCCVLSLLLSLLFFFSLSWTAVGKREERKLIVRSSADTKMEESHQLSMQVPVVLGSSIDIS